MIPKPIETPLRRSTYSAAVRTPIVAGTINDDEAERQASRASTSLLESSQTPSIIADNEGIKDCLKKFAENKINKNNAWCLSLIDNFSSIVKRHHNTLQNFQVCGSTLEASSKIYGLRVDSVHTEAMRMSAGLHRTKKSTFETEDDNENDQQNDMDSSLAPDEQLAADKQAKAAKKKQKKKVPKSTITKNKESLLMTLPTNACTDAVFAKLNSVVGDMNSSDRLMQYVLPTRDSELLLKPDVPYWDSSPAVPIELSDNLDFSNCTHISVPKIAPITNLLLRPQQTYYKILNTPAEDDTPDDSDKSFDQLQIDVAFDMDANDEPINENNDYIHHDFEPEDFDALTADDHTAINQCRNLRRVTTIIDDLRPIDGSSIHLEYSYRPLENISQYWAGPSHWKFKRSRGKSLGILRQINEKTKKKPLKNRIEPIEFDINFTETIFIPINSKAASKLKKANIYKKWDAKKFRLPTDLKLDRERFNKFTFAPGLMINSHEPIVEPEERQIFNDEEGVVGGESMSNDDHHADNNIDDDLPVENILLNLDATVAEISTNFAGAPETVVPIDVPFAKRAKVIDMKNLKKCCMSIIRKQCLETSRQTATQNEPASSAPEKYIPGTASFKKIYEILPSLLSTNMKEALSPAVAFYSILHLANEHRLRLSNDKINGFVIRQIDHDDDNNIGDN